MANFCKIYQKEKEKQTKKLGEYDNWFFREVAFPNNKAWQGEALVYQFLSYSEPKTGQV